MDHENAINRVIDCRGRTNVPRWCRVEGTLCGKRKNRCNMACKYTYLLAYWSSAVGDSNQYQAGWADGWGWSGVAGQLW